MSKLDSRRTCCRPIEGTIAGGRFQKYPRKAENRDEAEIGTCVEFIYLFCSKILDDAIHCKAMRKKGIQLKKTKGLLECYMQSRECAPTVNVPDILISRHPGYIGKVKIPFDSEQ